jgi:hypothetical protein
MLFDASFRPPPDVVRAQPVEAALDFRPVVGEEKTSRFFQEEVGNLRHRTTEYFTGGSSGQGLRGREVSYIADRTGARYQVQKSIATKARRSQRTEHPLRHAEQAEYHVERGVARSAARVRRLRQRTPGWPGSSCPGYRIDPRENSRRSTGQLHTLAGEIVVRPSGRTCGRQFSA